MISFCVGGAVAVGAQGDSGPLWFVHQEVARPGMLAAYDSTTKELMTMAVKDKAPLLSQAVVLQGEDLMYTIAIPVKDGNGSQAINTEFGMLAAKEGAKFADVMKRGMAPVESMREFLLQEHSELSYRPAKPALEAGEAHFYHYDIYYLVPGHEEDAAAIPARRSSAARSRSRGDWRGRTPGCVRISRRRSGRRSNVPTPSPPAFRRSAGAAPARRGAVLACAPRLPAVPWSTAATRFLR